MILLSGCMGRSGSGSPFSFGGCGLCRAQVTSLSAELSVERRVMEEAQKDALQARMEAEQARMETEQWRAEVSTDFLLQYVCMYLCYLEWPCLVNSVCRWLILRRQCLCIMRHV